ncbi:Sugar fermentation stimulation protein homolog [Chlamydiales bacterium SCGC AG-110-M15]|nr:Sugar fermentation stimulation protein homolog [Chlamydiales bacterium SCGC AG-110-M15]
MTSFTNKLIPGIFIKRYKRFLADIQLENGEVITAHCANSGSMKTCIKEGWKVYLSHHDNPKRKLAYTLELIDNGKCLICLNTHKANGIVKTAIENNLISELRGYTNIRPEVPYGSKSRIDLLLESDDSPPCFVEVKTVTLLGDNENYQFPDAVTTRGQKHLKDLMAEKEKGNRAVLFFLIQRSDGKAFEAAKDIDPEYAELLEKAKNKGVEVLTYLSDISINKIKMGSALA